MGERRRSSAVAVVHRKKKWNSILNAFFTLTTNLIKDRKLLEGRVRLLQGVVRKSEMEHKVQSLRGEFLLGLKERDAFLYKRRYEDIIHELDGVSELREHQDLQCSDQPNASNPLISKGESSSLNTGHEVETEKRQSSEDVSALLAEKTFIWNQYNKMEAELSEKLRSKDHEVKEANGKVSILLNRVEELEKSNQNLRNDLANIQSSSEQKDDEISRLKKEIQHLKSRQDLAATAQLLSSCRANSAAFSRKTSKDDRSADQKIRQVKKETKCTENSHGSSKRMAAEVINVGDDIPKLFTSSFKVPKLKSSSTPHLV
ncbi:hypothetical protein M569_11820 [Genlisea aurea]|uniref:Uncharacterized protein n=1 Tax=Genlisea aurea TaxID=192259 RepID=S8C870_9LAMI|nr:hypothetical protein M569_11820 [Genlisea aurea]